MHHTLSILGIIHTLISLLALVYAGVCLARESRINPFSNVGRSYMITTTLACFTSFGLSKEGGFNPGHALAIFILVLMIVAYLLKPTDGKRPVALYVQTFCMTTTVLISLMPAVNETLTRLPLEHPFAENINSPAVQNGFKILLVLYLACLIFQFIKLRTWIKGVATA
jgi:hypothetical protein